MSTLALGASSPAERGRATTALRYLDLLAVPVALALFAGFGWPATGFAVGAGAWLIQRGLQVLVSRHASALQARGERRKALGFLAGITLGRVWLVSLGVLIAGLVDRDTGLAAAVLVAALFTLYLASQFLTRLISGDWGA